MIKRISDHIDKNLFVQDVLDKIDIVDNIIVDSFVSNSCNLDCNHCYFLDYTPQRTPLTLEKWKELLFQWIDNGVKHFHFSGKEPFCDNRVQTLLSYLNYCRDGNLFYGLVTNGMVDPVVFQKLLNTNISYIEISIEGLKDFDNIIRGSVHFQTVEKLISTIEYCSKINLTTTIFEQNIDNLISLVRHFSNMGVTKFNFSPYLEFSKNTLLPAWELSSNSVLRFLRNCFDFLSTENDLEVPIDIRVCLTKTQCYELFIKANFLTEKIENYLYNGQPIIYKVGKHILEVNFPLLTIPFLSQLVITHDGYIISCADDIHFENIQDVSLGNVWELSIVDVLHKRRQYILNYLKEL